MILRIARIDIYWRLLDFYPIAFSRVIYHNSPCLQLFTGDKLRIPVG